VDAAAQLRTTVMKDGGGTSSCYSADASDARRRKGEKAMG